MRSRIEVMLLIVFVAASAAWGQDVPGQGEVIAATQSGIDSASAPVSAPPVATSPGNRAVAIALFGAASALSVALFMWLRPDRFPQTPLRRLPPQTMLALFAGMLIAGLLGAQVAMKVGLADLHLPETASTDERMWNSIVFLVAAAIANALVVGIWLILSASQIKRPETERSARRVARSVLFGAAGFFIFTPWVVGATQVTVWIQEYVSGQSTPLIAHESLKLMAESQDPTAWWTLTGFVTIVVPVMEEVMYRALGQGALRALGLDAWPSIVVASAIFTAMHIGAVEPAGLVGLFVLAIGLGMIYERTGSVAGSIVMHAMFNAANVAALVQSQRLTS